MRTPAEREKLGIDLKVRRKKRQTPVDPDNPIVTKAIGELIKTGKVPDPPDPTDAEKQAIEDSLLQADGDIQDIWERRILNPNQRKSEPIRTKTKGIHLRWINLAANGRYQRARHEQGWQPLHKTELVDEREIYGVMYSPEGYVCRGEKMQEMLMFIPDYIFKKICQSKYNDVLKSQKQLRENMQNSANAHFTDKYGRQGEEIADRLSNFKGEVRFGREAVAPDEEEEQLVRAGLGD